MGSNGRGADIMSCKKVVVKKTLYFGADHAGFHLKEELRQRLAKEGYNTVDLGVTSDTKPVDYPDIVVPVIEAIGADLYACGILLCGSGIGMSIKANRYPYIRAALCHNAEYARLAREHNDANILVLGARFLDIEEAYIIAKKFLETAFAKGRHQLRVEKLL